MQRPVRSFAGDAEVLSEGVETVVRDSAHFAFGYRQRVDAFVPRRLYAVFPTRRLYEWNVELRVVTYEDGASYEFHKFVKRIFDRYSIFKEHFRRNSCQYSGFLGKGRCRAHQLRHFAGRASVFDFDGSYFDNLVALDGETGRFYVYHDV